MTPPLLTSRFDGALAFAADLHRLQARKGTATPYVSHLLGVCSLVLEAGGGEDQAIAALLHDAVEDQGGRPTLERIRYRFGDAVANIVEDCTDSFTEPKPPWHERKSAYLASLTQKPLPSLLVSLADKVHNARAIVTDRRVSEAVWDRFSQPKSDTIRYYRALATVFLERLPGPLAEELDAAVTSMETERTKR